MSILDWLLIAYASVCLFTAWRCLRHANTSDRPIHTLNDEAREQQRMIASMQNLIQRQRELLDVLRAANESQGKKLAAYIIAERASESEARA